MQNIRNKIIHENGEIPSGNTDLLTFCTSNGIQLEVLANGNSRILKLEHGFVNDAIENTKKVFMGIYNETLQKI